MEELGIGRPSTYTAILSVLRERGYVRMEKKRLIPKTRAASSRHFSRLFSPAMSNMASPPISRNCSTGFQRARSTGRRSCAISGATLPSPSTDTKDLRVTHVLDALNDILAPHIFPPRPDGGDPRNCPSCAEGQLSLKLGKFGAFVGCSNYPDCRYTRQISSGEGSEREAVPAEGILLGNDPETGLPVHAAMGRFGPYVQLGEADE